jgi:DNA/RNA-binding domain of Phe-tRNA-synthetase-like protein
MSEAAPFVVADDCVRLGLRAGAVVFRGVHVSGAPAALRSAIAREVEAIRGRFANPAAVRSAPDVIYFQHLLRKVGVNPRKEQPSLERLLLCALKRGDLPVINNLVDAYNLVSVRTGCSLGAHDLDRMAVPVALRLLSGHESFTPLGGSGAVPVVRGEYGYVDAADRLLCRLDVVQADFSKVTNATRNVLLIVEGTVAHAPAALRRALAEVVELVTGYCGGSAHVIAYPSGVTSNA